LVVFDDNSVYQGGTEADTIGQEIVDLNSLKTRFESFTGEKLENIDNCWDEIDNDKRICDSCEEEHILMQDNKDGSYTCISCLIKIDDGNVIDNSMGCS
jgi:hypothetical protein